MRMADGSNVLSALIQRSGGRDIQDIHMRALREGMNTCVCSSRAVNTYSSAGDALKGASR